MVPPRSIHDDDEPITVERYIVVGDPTIVARALSGRAAATTALLELEAADAERTDDDEPITRELPVPAYTATDFHPSLIDALIAFEAGMDDDIVFDEPRDDRALLLCMLEPHVDFATLAALSFSHPQI